MDRAGAARDHRNGSWEAHPRALSRRGAQDRGPIRGARRKGVLQRPNLPPRRPEVSHPGWGSRGQRDGWIRPADPGGVQREETRRWDGGHGSLARSGQRRQPVLYLPGAAAVPRRQVHGLRAGRGRPGRVAQDPGGRRDAHGDAAALVFVSVVLVIVRVRSGDYDAALLTKGLLLGRRRNVSFTSQHDARLVRVLLLQMRGYVGMVHRQAADEPREEAVGTEPRP